MLDPAAQHHDLALKLLVGRSLPHGLPWSVDEDKELIIEERLLWARMSPEEQEAEQASLSALWGKRGATRTVSVSHSWGPWTTKLPPTVSVPDAAFGLPTMGYVPWSKGPYTQCPDNLMPVMQWLWLRGYQVVDSSLSEGSHGNTIVIPLHRGMHEADRLMGLIAGLKGMDGKIGTQQDSSGKVTIRSVYDPVAGTATIELANVQHLIGKVPAR